MNISLKTLGLSGLLAISLAFVAGAQAEDKGAAKPNLDKIKQTIASALKAAKPEVDVISVETSPIGGLYKTTLSGGHTVYTTSDGQYFVAGEVFQVVPGNIVNLTEQDKSKDRAKAIAEINKKDTIAFPAVGQTKKVMYVFTDVDCGYCRLLHSKMAEYNQLGIEVRYLAYPRAGVGSETYNKLVTAWCSTDRNQALTKIKSGEDVPAATCENPVAAQFQLGERLGVNGTPALIFEDGQLVAGFIEPDRVKAMFNL
jgi:thiol:disulfide interchange protein DsbC